MKVGDRVVCIETDCSMITIKDLKYEIIDIGGKSGYALFFKNIDNGIEFIYDGLSYWGFNANRFRKIEPNFTNALTRKLATDFIEEDNKVIETEKERVLTKEL